MFSGGRNFSSSRQKFFSFIISLLRGRREFFFVDFPHRIGHPAARQAKAGQENVQGFLPKASVDARHAAGGPRMPRPHRRPDRHTWHQPFRLPDVGPRGVLPRMPSLLQFDRQVRGGGDPVMARNLRSLFGVGRAPSDTWMRQRLDGVDPRDLRRCFTGIHAALQRGKVLEGWTVFGGHPLVSVDGTGYHSSHRVNCRSRCVKEHRDGTRTYHHQALGAAVVHPDIGEVLPLAPEPIRREDGSTKNDCERNAGRRLIGDLRREHPHMKAIIAGDALASNGPHIKLLKEKDLRFILGAKPGDHRLLFSWFEASGTRQTWERRDRKTGTVQRSGWDHGLPPTDANFDLRVNMPVYEETDSKGEGKMFPWVTDLPLGRDTVMSVMRFGRRRWAIGNETFQTPRQGICTGSSTISGTATTIWRTSSRRSPCPRS